MTGLPRSMPNGIDHNVDQFNAMILICIDRHRGSPAMINEL